MINLIIIWLIVRSVGYGTTLWPKKDIHKHGVELNDIFKLHVKSGVNTQFWLDKWIGSTQLKENILFYMLLILGKKSLWLTDFMKIL